MVVGASVRRSLAALAALAVVAAGCSSTERKDPQPSPSPSAAAPASLSFAVYGPAPVVAAYRKIAATYTAAHPGSQVRVQAYATHDQALAALRRSQAAGDPPDLFLMDHDDLAGLSQDKAIRRVDDLLAERQVDFGDGYTRSGLEAFSADASLQCMPNDVSPLVVYYNPRLIELDQIREAGRAPVTQETGWSLEEFGLAARQPKAPGVRGLYVAPDIEQVAPFIWSGGGEVVDDNVNPTTLTLSDGSSSGALQQLLELVRDPSLTFSQAALRQKSALDRFKAGKLGMILGFRDLTPVLRAQQNLTFDVMPLPKVGRGATIATMSGLCISAGSQHVQAAADLLTSVISPQGAGALAATGYVMPASLDVVNNDVFMQTGQRPLHSDVFGREVRDTRLLPSTPRWPLVRRSLARDLTQLFYQPVILSLQDRLDAVDAASVPLLDPSKVASATPSPTQTSTP